MVTFRLVVQYVVKSTTTEATDSPKKQFFVSEDENFSWTQTYQDASNGIAEGGLAYMSNLKVMTAPCQREWYNSKPLITLYFHSR